MTHHAVSFWPFLQYVPLCLGLLVFRLNAQCLQSWTLTSLLCINIFSITVFFLALVEQGGEYSLLNCFKLSFPIPLSQAATDIRSMMPPSRHVFKAGFSLL